jgi:hypothetical protein
MDRVGISHSTSAGKQEQRGVTPGHLRRTGLTPACRSRPSARRGRCGARSRHHEPWTRPPVTAAVALVKGDEANAAVRPLVVVAGDEARDPRRAPRRTPSFPPLPGVDSHAKRHGTTAERNVDSGCNGALDAAVRADELAVDAWRLVFESSGRTACGSPRRSAKVNCGWRSRS